MSKCGKCGAEAKKAVKFCKSCGHTLSDSSFTDKKARVMTAEKNWVKPGLIVAALVVLVAGIWIFRQSGAVGNPQGKTTFAPYRDTTVRTANANPVKARNGEVRIPLSSVTDGNAHFFSFNAGGKIITFFAMKAADGRIRTAFDACIACNHAKLGYRQKGDVVVCNNCGIAFSPSDIGKSTGGCNPIPLPKKEEGQMIVLKATDLDAGVQYF